VNVTPGPFVVVTTIRRPSRSSGLVTQVWGPYDTAEAAHAARAEFMATPAGTFRNPDGGLRARVHRMKDHENFQTAPTPPQETT
jgi:hypothetical protein